MNLDKTCEIFKNVSRTTQRGEDTLQEVIAAIQQIFIKIQVVQKISSQTSILSLNVSIEASRVGKSGKEQESTANQINDNIGEMEKTAQEDTTTAEYMKKLSDKFNEQVRGLNEVIAEFTYEDE